MTWISRHFSSIQTLGVGRQKYSKVWHTDAAAPWIPTSVHFMQIHASWKVAFSLVND